MWVTNYSLILGKKIALIYIKNVKLQSSYGIAWRQNLSKQ